MGLEVEKPKMGWKWGGRERVGCRMRGGRQIPGARKQVFKERRAEFFLKGGRHTK